MTIRIGWLGVGLMGHGAAKNILERGGHPLAIMGHRNREPADDLVRRGAVEVGSLAELAAAADIVFLCLPSAAEVAATVEGPGKLLDAMPAGSILVDTTTCDPTVTRRIGAVAAGRGIAMLDAALGRTPREAEAGKLATYVGGDAAVLDRVRPIMATYADTIIHCGPLGAGTTAKLCNNAITIGTCALIAESLATASKLGVDLLRLAEVLSAGGADGRMWQMMKPWLLEADDSHLKGPLRIAVKDVRTFRAMAEAAGLEPGITRSVIEVYSRAIEAGHAETFMPVLPGILASLNGAPIRDL